MKEYDDSMPSTETAAPSAGALVPLREYAVPVCSPVQGRVLTSYDLSTREGKLGAFRCKQQGDFKASDVVNQIYEVEHIMLHRVELEKDGELVQSTRCVLVSPDGLRLTFVSDIVARQVVDMVTAFGPVPFKPALKVMVKQIDLGNAKRTYELDVVQ